MRSLPPASDPTSRAAQARQLLTLRRPLEWETCEPRLVLSAQLLSDVIDPLQLQQHGLLNPQIDMAPQLPVLGNEIGSGPGLEPHASQAHQQSGWTSAAQEFGLKGSGQTVAVIDSGIAWDHWSLGKGFGAGYRVVGGWDFAENDSNPYDDGPSGFHGTHVTGIIGSDHAQNSGVAPDVDLVGLRVFNDAGQGQIQWVEQALAWVHTNRHSFANPITPVNLSLGTTWNADTVPSWGTLEDELKQLYDDGIIVTASAGNSFKQYNAPGLSYPAASPYVLPVSSVDDNGLLSDFSQRSDRVLAAPGRNILSTVPDHVLGRDGKVNDFSTASGTSMAAPYVAGASVLVREAMEMVGIQDITSGKIIDWLHDTADTVYDSITRASYNRLNLQQAIDTLIPDDNTGDASSTAQVISLNQKSLSSWINHLGDSDVYRFTASATGQLTLDADSQWAESLRWTISQAGQPLVSAGLEGKSLALQAGQSYELRLQADQEIGPYSINLAFQSDTVSPPNSTPINPTPVPVPSPSPTEVTDLGTVDYLTREVSAGSSLRATAKHDGLFTVQWDNADAATGNLSVRDASGTWHRDTTWADGKLRLDLTATAGQTFDIVLPGQSSDRGNLTLVDVLQLQGKELTIRDTAGSDDLVLDLSRGVSVVYGQVQYDFQNSQIERIAMSGAINNDELTVVGSPLVDRVEMRVGQFTLGNSQLTVTAQGIEKVHFDSGTGVNDSLVMYDSDGDDVLTARADSVELSGLGFQFSAAQIDRYFVHATGQGQDMAYLYDSAGNDQLSVRPQFTSMWNDNYFVSVRGFERVFVYATAGGYDSADLYDSAGNDRFSTSGDSASIVGPGFHSYTRFFEQVHAHATAGGQDLATLYGSGQQTQWLRGSDFVSFREDQWDRHARGFERTEALVNGLPQSIPDASSVSSNRPLSILGEASIDSAPQADYAAPMVASPAMHAFTDMNMGIDMNMGMVVNIGVDVGQATPAPSSQLSDADLAAGLLLEALELQLSTRDAVGSDELYWHDNPEAEREMLDEIFTRYGM
ncbi:MAG: S8 family serine peptidase [Pirellulaceae bacterium]|nr:S8 family serine peptidase [Pirellulaceae bacterium]